MLPQQEFENIFQEIIEELKKKNQSKGWEYSRHNDRLHNFKQGAQMLGCEPYVYLWILRNKHEVSIQDMVADWSEGITHSKELWKEKITDSIMYSILLYAMLYDSDIETETKDGLRDVYKSCCKLSEDSLGGECKCKR